MFNPYNSYSWTSCLFSTLNTIKEIPKESLKQWTYNTHTIANRNYSAILATLQIYIFFFLLFFLFYLQGSENGRVVTIDTIASKLKKIREMLLTTLEHNQHDVIDVI